MTSNKLSNVSLSITEHESSDSFALCLCWWIRSVVKTYSLDNSLFFPLLDKRLANVFLLIPNRKQISFLQPTSELRGSLHPVKTKSQWIVFWSHALVIQAFFLKLLLCSFQNFDTVVLFFCASSCNALQTVMLSQRITQNTNIFASLVRLKEWSTLLFFDKGFYS